MRKMLIFILLLVSVGVGAKESRTAKAKETKGTKESRAIKTKQFFEKVGKFADEWYMRGLDTAYVGLPKHRFKLALSSDIGNVYTIIQCSDIPYYESLDMRMRSNLTPKIGLVIGYRNLGIGYSVNLYKGYSNLKFSITQSAFGLEFRMRKASYTKGYIDAASTEGRYDLSPGDLRVTTFFLNAYYAFNRKRFSMPAAFNQSYIQRRSAGSVLIYADFLYSDIENLTDALITQGGGLREMELYQTAVGVGYGYNYTPNKGKFLLHVSGGVELAFFNRMLITGDSRMFMPNSSYNLIFSQKIKPQYWVYVTGRVKLALVYNINDRFFIAANAVVNNIRFKSKDHVYKTDSATGPDTNPEVSMRLMTWDWNAVLLLGVRF